MGLDDPTYRTISGGPILAARDRFFPALYHTNIAYLWPLLVYAVGCPLGTGSPTLFLPEVGPQPGFPNFPYGRLVTPDWPRSDEV